MSTPERPFLPPPLPPAAILALPSSPKATPPRAGETLAAFVAELKERGFKVGGLLQETRRENGRKVAMDLVEIDSGRRTSIHQDLGQGSSCTVDTSGMADASQAVRRAIAGRHDLVVVNKFSHLERDGEGLSSEMLDAMADGLPLLTTVSPEFAQAWMEFTGGQALMLPPDSLALWRWWGPERLYQDLALAARRSGAAKRVVIGLNWTMVEGPDGVGLAQTPSRDRPGCRALPDAGGLAGRPLAELAQEIEAADPFHAAIAAAAINAAINRRDLEGEALNGLDAFANFDGPVAVVGRFPGVAERLKQPRILERAPAAGEYPDTAAPWLLPACEAAIVTASALANRSLPAILTAAHGRPLALVGPGCPLSPRLFSYGIDVLSGLVIDDTDGLAQAVAEGGGAKALKRHGRLVTLKKP